MMTAIAVVSVEKKMTMIMLIAMLMLIAMAIRSYSEKPNKEAGTNLKKVGGDGGGK